METLKIISFSILSAVLFGIIHDQVTVRICVEYFTIGHPPIFTTNSITLLALGWGIIATWWVGLILGSTLAFAARVGKKIKVNFSQIKPKIIKLLIIMAIFAFVAGAIGYFLASTGVVFLIEPMSSRIPKDKHIPFLLNLWAHSASYLVGFIGGIILAVHVWRLRNK